MADAHPDILTIFGEAVALSSEEDRSKYVAEACRRDPKALRRVEALVRAHFDVGNFLGAQIGVQAVANDQFAVEPPGTQIGPYKLREQIGAGGFGVVYVAEQEKPVARKVALKIIKPGMGSKEVIARFEAERQALALMDHPHIAKVLDVGATDSARPYFVMELVKGVPITDFCDEQTLSTHERLQLFVDVCRAVQHAHHKGIIHRDLKPSNVMVTLHDDKPVVKVIDFGVSKALSSKLTDQTVYTAYGQMLGTPLYMSPEQAQLSGLDVDTRSDVYSLGVLMYELLTGTTPFDKESLKNAGFDELRRIIREDEPPRPSARISTLRAEMISTVSDKRRIGARKLGQSYRGELDWIVMKALEKDRNRRYESASAFATDVQRYLQDEPVQAGPPSAWYRFRKFGRRNRVALTMAALVGLLVLAAVALLGANNLMIARERDLTDAALKQERASLRAKAEALATAEEQRQRAQTNFKQASFAINSMLTDVANSQMTRDVKLQPVRRGVLRRAAQLYQGFIRPERADRASREEAAYAYLQLINIHNSLGDSDAAEEAARQAQRRYETLTVDFPAVQEYWSGLALTHQARGSRLIRTFGRQQEAVLHLRHAIKLWTNLRSESELQANYESAFAACCDELGYLLWSAFQRTDEAERLLRQASETRQKLVARFPESLDFRKALAATQISRGVLLRSIKRLPEAEQALQAALEILNGLSANAVAGDSRLSQARALGHLEGIFRRSGRATEADAAGRKAMALKEALVADYPLNAELRRNLAAGHRGTGTALEAKGRLPDAEKAYRRALLMQEKLLADFPNLPDVRGQLAITLFRLINLLGTQRRHAEVAGLFRRIQQLTPDSLDAHNNLAWYLATCPDPQFRDPRRAVELAGKAVAASPRHGIYWNTLGVSHYRAGNWRDAVAALDKSRGILKARYDSFNSFFLAMAHWRLGDSRQARQWYDQAVQWMEKHHPKNNELRRFRAEAEALLGIPVRAAKPSRLPVPGSLQRSPRIGP